MDFSFSIAEDVDYSEDEPEADGLHEGAQGQPHGRMPAHDHPDSRVLRVLLHDPNGGGTARRRVPVGDGSIAP